MPEIFRIFETDTFLKDLKKGFGGEVGVLYKKLSSYVYPILKQQPYFGHNIKKLVDFKPPTWRYRTGNYRVFYTIDAKEKTVYMLKISDRKDAY